MLFTITGKNMEVTDEVKTHAKEKTEKLPRFFDNVNQVDVIVEHGPNNFYTVETIARGEHSMVFVATEQNTEIFTAIDLAVHKLEGQLRKKKTMQRNTKHAAS